ncbi:ABC transporter substrate-binding protein [Paenibacillus filicis]|uniref:ABC transporter substrate-binding protein n=1 Tax=Paenibacillus filicis TaxID=669464 RepID=A0ABU9DU89_9BACL
MHRTQLVLKPLLPLLLAAALTACGGSSGTTTTPGTGEAQATPPAAASADSKKPSTRIVKTDKGDIEIPANPKKVVAPYYHGTLLALGIQPIAANKEWWMGSPFLAEQEKTIQDIGAPTSLEKVTSLEPDLIVINDFDVKTYDQLSKIAPTLHVPYTAYHNPKEEVKLFGELLDRGKEAEQWLKQYEEKAAAGRAKIKSFVGADETAVIVNVRGKKVSILGDNYGRGGFPIYDALKLKAPDIVKKEVIDSGAQIKEISLELLPQYASADHIFICFNAGSTEEDINNVLNNSVWNSLPAVKNNKVHKLDYNTFLHYDPISITGQIDLIATMLAEKKS